MLSVKKEEDGNTLRAELDGTIDETVSFEILLGTSMKRLEIRARGVNRINSPGVKAWRDYFHKLRRAGVTLRFRELSPILVSQMNFITGFVETGELDSLCLPFFCESCGKVTFDVRSPSDAKRIRDELPSVECETCKGPTEFDELPSDYFAFLGD